MRSETSQDTPRLATSNFLFFLDSAAPRKCKAVAVQPGHYDGKVRLCSMRRRAGVSGVRIRKSLAQFGHAHLVDVSPTREPNTRSMSQYGQMILPSMSVVRKRTRLAARILVTRSGSDSLFFTLLFQTAMWILAACFSSRSCSALSIAMISVANFARRFGSSQMATSAQTSIHRLFVLGPAR